FLSSEESYGRKKAGKLCSQRSSAVYLRRRGANGNRRRKTNIGACPRNFAGQLLPGDSPAALQQRTRGAGGSISQLFSRSGSRSRAERTLRQRTRDDLRALHGFFIYDRHDATRADARAGWTASN